MQSSNICMLMYFFKLKKCFALPKLLYFLNTNSCFNHPALWEKYFETERDERSKVCKANFDDISNLS